MRKRAIENIISLIESGLLTDSELQALIDASTKQLNKQTNIKIVGQHMNKKSSCNLDDEILYCLFSNTFSATALARKHNVSRQTVLKHKQHLENSVDMEEYKRLYEQSIIDKQLKSIELV